MTTAALPTNVDRLFPPIPLAAWEDTKQTLHRFVQVVGKIRLAASIRRNHWWHVPFHVTGRGVTTRPMGTDPIFTIDFDFVGHRLELHTSAGRTAAFSLVGQSVASFYAETLAALDGLDVAVTIDRPEPFDLDDSTPFAEDTAHDAYDAAWVTRYWRVLSRMNLVLERYAADFSGKTSPVHHFWHTLDIAVTRFSDRRIAQPPETDSVTREGYSREVISAGFWFGDDNLPTPALYSYTTPEPAGLSDTQLQPDAAEWRRQNGSHLAILRYDDMRATTDPLATALTFYDSAYQAGARLAGWDADRLACPGGTTDPFA